MDQWAFKHLELSDGRLVEDGEPIEPRKALRERSIELIHDGWEPVEATELTRRYRRSLGFNGAIVE